MLLLRLFCGLYVCERPAFCTVPETEPEENEHSVDTRCMNELREDCTLNSRLYFLNVNSFSLKSL